jgi:hypothetical protein
MLEATDEIITLNDDSANRTIALVANTRAPFYVQQVKGGVFIFGRSMISDRVL